MHSHVSDFSHIWHFFTHWTGKEEVEEEERSHCCWGRKRTTAVSLPPGRPPWLPPELEDKALEFSLFVPVHCSAQPHGAFACLKIAKGQKIQTYLHPYVYTHTRIEIVLVDQTIPGGEITRASLPNRPPRVAAASVAEVRWQLGTRPMGSRDTWHAPAKLPEPIKPAWINP